MTQSIGKAYIEVVPSGKGFGKTIEAPITDAINSASKKGSTTLIGKIGNAFKTIGKTALGAVGAIGGGIVALAAKGGFERALAIENAQAKLKGLKMDSAQIKAVMNDALKSVKGTAFGLGDAATVAASLSAAGVKSGAQLEGVLKTVADVAQVSGRSLTDVGTIFGSVAARGKLQGDDMLQLMSSGVPVLAALGQRLGKTSGEISDMVSAGKIDFQTFSDAMHDYVGGAALSAGDTFTGAMANCKAALGRLGEKIAAPVLNGLRDMANQAIPLLDGFAQTCGPFMESVGKRLQDGLSNAIPVVQEFFTNLADSPYVRDLGDACKYVWDRLVELTTAVMDMLGWMPSWADAFDAVKGHMPDLIRLFGDLLGIITEVIDFTNSSSNWLTPLAVGIMGIVGASKGLKMVNSGLAAIPKALSGITGAAQGVINFITIMPELGGFAATLKSVAGGMSLVKNAQAAWNAVTTMTSTVWRALGAVIAANPIGAIITAVVALVGALVWFFTQTETGRQMWSAFMDWLKNAWESVVGFFSDLWDGIVDIFKGAVESVTNAWNGITDFFTGLWDSITGVFQAAIDWIGSFLQSGWGQALLFLINPLAGIINFIVQHFDTIKNIIVNVCIVIAAVFVTLWNGVKAVFETVWNAIVAFVTTIVNGLQSFFQTVFGAIAAFLTTIWNRIKSVTATVWNAISSFFKTVLNAIKSIFTTVWNAIVGFLSPIFNGIRNTISNVLNVIRSIWTSAWNSVKSVFTSIWNGLVSSIGGFIGKIAAKVKGIKGTILGALSGAGQWLVSVGKNIIQGLINGIGGAFEWVKSKITNLGSSVLGWAKGVLGINSPSRVFRDKVGLMVGQGMGIGIENSMSFVKKRVNEMLDIVPNEIETGFNPSTVGSGTNNPGASGLAFGTSYTVYQTVNNPVATPWPVKTAEELDRQALGV
ncbi:tape measure protein [Bifidobacterium sp.]|uniref:tape measure protein n=1 Tax=Bifidobacterium sp. TaxID=41200 RepID=UPI0039EA1908